ncbi:MAG TPA: extracellular solute-binding protein [Nocardioidaceae bacterium]|nr:extracellular solute-binding protein [Nocardioidaceae bacterium]
MRTSIGNTQMSRRGPRAVLAGVALAVLAAAAGCGGDNGGGGGDGDNQITVWTLENLPDRMAAQKKIAAAFTKQSGIKVKLVGVAEDQYSQLLTSAAASGELPDLVGALSLSGVRELAVNELSNSDVAAAVIDDLGEETFSKQALELTRDGDEQLSVPSDGWAQLLVYRKDLFDKAGLAAPETYADITAAAKKLDSGDVAGFVGANVANDAFTEQTFEHLALANGCEMVDDKQEVTLDTSNCAEAFSFYGDLIQNYSVPGTQDVDTTRATYFAGDAAMVIWSSFILDELAGLRNDAKPTCAECKSDPAALAKMSGVVTALQGPSGTEPAQFGEVVSWVATIDADADASEKFISYMMEEGYTDWIGFAPEGKIPTRQGTADDPTKYIDAWSELPAGVDTKAPLSDFYDAEVLDALRTSPDTIQRWAITQGAGGLLGATLSELPVAQEVNKVTTGEVDGETAAKEADDAVTSIQDSLK